MKKDQTIGDNIILRLLIFIIRSFEISATTT